MGPKVQGPKRYSDLWLWNTGLDLECDLDQVEVVYGYALNPLIPGDKLA